MRTMIIDGNSTLDLAFLAGKFNGAIKRHKKTVAAIKFDGIRMNRTGKTGRKRAAVELQIVQELNFDMRNWSVEGDQKLLEAEFAGAYDHDQGDSWDEERCLWCGDFGCHSSCRDEPGDSYSHYSCDSRLDDSCELCGCRRCQCDYDYGHVNDDYGIYRHEVSFDNSACKHDPNPMTDEEKMKLSDELWLDHEFFHGRNNLRTMYLRTMSGPFNNAYSYRETDAYWGFGTDFLVCDDEAVDEFGGLPNHFDPSFDYRTHFWKGAMYDWDFSVDFTDFTMNLDPMKARRASRFSEIAGGNVKRVGRPGRTHSDDDTGWYDKVIAHMKDKTAAKRAFKRLLEETFATEPKKGKKLRFRSMWDKEQYEALQGKGEQRHARRQEAAEWEAYKRALEREADETEAYRRRDEYGSAEHHAYKRDANKSDARKRNAISYGAGYENSAQNESVDFSLPIRRKVRGMVYREVQVTRVTNVNGRREVVSDGIEKMLCRG